eukprot:365303-Chlamydomonas_euryale.AAC.59
MAPFPYDNAAQRCPCLAVRPCSHAWCIVHIQPRHCTFGCDVQLPLSHIHTRTEFAHCASAMNSLIAGEGLLGTRVWGGL